MAAGQDAVDKFAAAVETERLRSSFVELLDDEPFSRLAEWAESLQEIADVVVEARDAIEAWAVEEDREAKADARLEALDALDRLVSAWVGSPLDVDTLADFEPADEDDDA